MLNFPASKTFLIRCLRNTTVFLHNTIKGENEGQREINRGRTFAVSSLKIHTKDRVLVGLNNGELWIVNNHDWETSLMPNIAYHGRH